MNESLDDQYFYDQITEQEYYEGANQCVRGVRNGNFSLREISNIMYAMKISTIIFLMEGYDVPWYEIQLKGAFKYYIKTHRMTVDQLINARMFPSYDLFYWILDTHPFDNIQSLSELTTKASLLFHDVHFLKYFIYRMRMKYFPEEDVVKYIEKGEWIYAIVVPLLSMYPKQRFCFEVPEPFQTYMIWNKRTHMYLQTRKSIMKVYMILKLRLNLPYDICAILINYYL